MICHGCLTAGAGLRYQPRAGGAVWFHPMCWERVREFRYLLDETSSDLTIYGECADNGDAGTAGLSQPAIPADPLPAARDSAANRARIIVDEPARCVQSQSSV